jgi:hypothetical protein
MTAIAATRLAGLGAALPASAKMISLTKCNFLVAMESSNQRVVDTKMQPSMTKAGGLRRMLLPLAVAIFWWGTGQADQIASPQVDSDRTLRIGLAITGGQPLHCRLTFGHWVERDLGLIAPGASVDIDVSQAKDGALYIKRDDGRRHMMIENISCGLDGQWMESYEQVDFAPAGSRQPGRIDASCTAPAAGGRVVCQPVRLGD